MIASMVYVAQYRLVLLMGCLHPPPLPFLREDAIK